MDRSTADQTPPPRAQADLDIARVLGEEMMSRRFLDSAPHYPRLQSGVLLLMVLQQVVSRDPNMQIAHQQRGVSATGAIDKPAPSVWERNDP